jgi:hypothetical protein
VIETQPDNQMQTFQNLEGRKRGKKGRKRGKEGRLKEGWKVSFKNRVNGSSHGNF